MRLVSFSKRILTSVIFILHSINKVTHVWAKQYIVSHEFRHNGNNHTSLTYDRRVAVAQLREIYLHRYRPTELSLASSTVSNVENGQSVTLYCLSCLHAVSHGQLGYPSTELSIEASTDLQESGRNLARRSSSRDSEW